VNKKNRNFRNVLDVEGVILAGGFSQRAGTFKPGLLLKEKKILHWVIDTMEEFCSRIIIVGGYQLERIEKMTEGYPDVRVVFNPLYPSGMFGSVKEGVKHTAAPWLFITPGDVPLVQEFTYRALLDAQTREPDQLVFIPVYRGKKGHPILLSHNIIPQILEEPSDSTLKHVLRRNPYSAVEVNDEGISIDIDTMEDFDDALRILDSRMRNAGPGRKKQQPEL